MGVLDWNEAQIASMRGVQTFKFKLPVRIAYVGLCSIFVTCSNLVRQALSTNCAHPDYCPSLSPMKPPSSTPRTMEYQLRPRRFELSLHRRTAPARFGTAGAHSPPPQIHMQALANNTQLLE